MKVLDKKKGIIQISPYEAIILSTCLFSGSGMFQKWIEKAPKNSYRHKAGVEGKYHSHNMFELLQDI